MASRRFAFACLLSLSASLGCTALLGIDDDYKVGGGGAGGTGSTGVTTGNTGVTTGSTGVTTGATMTTSSGVGGGMPDCQGKPDMCGDACVNLQNDPVNCGACGHECGTSSTCSAGLCSVREVMNDNSPIRRLATDGTNVYWTTELAVKRVSTNGGMPTTWALSPSPWGIVVDDNFVYWAATGGNILTDGGIFRRGKSDMMATKVVADENGPQEIAINTNDIFWICENPVAGTVKKVGKGAVQLSQPTVLSSESKPPSAISADANFVYLTDPTSETVFKIDFMNGNAVHTVAGNQKNPVAIADGGGSIAWAAKDSNSGQGVIMMSPKSTNMPMALTQKQSLNEPNSVAFSAIAMSGYYYFTDRQSGTVNRVKADGSEFLRLAEGQIDADNVAVDGSFVYWSVNDSGSITNPHRIRRVRK